MVHRLAKKHVKAYHKKIEEIKDEKDVEKQFEIKELYYRCRLIQDYISGMTDQFAHDEYQELSVSNL